jgi:hypothetical protein
MKLYTWQVLIACFFVAGSATAGVESREAATAAVEEVWSYLDVPDPSESTLVVTRGENGTLTINAVSASSRTGEIVGTLEILDRHTISETTRSETITMQVGAAGYDLVAATVSRPLGGDVYIFGVLITMTKESVGEHDAISGAFLIPLGHAATEEAVRKSALGVLDPVAAAAERFEADFQGHSGHTRASACGPLAQQCHGICRNTWRPIARQCLLEFLGSGAVPAGTSIACWFGCPATGLGAFPCLAGCGLAVTAQIVIDFIEYKHCHDGAFSGEVACHNRCHVHGE